MQNTFRKEIINELEPHRLAALRRYRIFNTEAENSFKNIARLVAEVFDVKIAMIALVDDEEVSFQSSVGMDTTIGPRGESFCSLTVLHKEVHVEEDALDNPVVAVNPLVCGEFGLRFYAGAPLITPDGFMIGTVCIVDTVPRKFSQHQRKILQGMATVVMEQIELRLLNLQEAERQAEVNDQLIISNDKLTASEVRFQSILDTMAEGVGIINTAGQIVYANAMAQRILGLTHNEIKTMTFNDPRWQNQRVDGTPLPDEEHPMTIMMRTGQSLVDQEIAVQPPDRERFYISINVAPILDNQGNITGGVGTFMDVTNRRKTLQQKDEFINVASHELKTPVTSLKASLQVMNRIKGEHLPKSFDMMLSQASRSLDKLTKLISALLDGNRIAQGQLQLRKTSFHIESMLESCCAQIQVEGKYQIEIEGDVEGYIYGDEQQIDQVISNLINNAVKYAPGSMKILIQVHQLIDSIKISVNDKGPGIDPSVLPHIFERYYRADYSGFQFSGLGLGLYICKGIIEKHGGEIGVDSIIGTGSTFWFTLPV